MLQPYQPHMAQTPYFFALGNHDLYSGVFHYLEAFYLPTNSVSQAQHAVLGTSPEHYYSFDQGDAHFTVLFVPFISHNRLSTGDPQYQWLTNDLAQTTKPWKIVLWHVPMNSSSAHRSDDYDFTGTADRLEIRDVLLPATRYGVQLVLCGHEHGYERFNPTNGVHSITTAGGGGVLYGFTELDEASAFFEVRYNCVRVQIQGDTLRAEALAPLAMFLILLRFSVSSPPRQFTRPPGIHPSCPALLLTTAPAIFWVRRSISLGRPCRA